MNHQDFIIHTSCTCIAVLATVTDDNTN